MGYQRYGLRGVRLYYYYYVTWLCTTVTRHASTIAETQYGLFCMPAFDDDSRHMPASRLPQLGVFFYSSSLKMILMTTTCIQWRQSRQTVWQPLLFISLPVLFISRLQVPSLTAEGRRSFYFVVSLIQSIVYSENGQSTCVALWCYTSLFSIMTRAPNPIQVSGISVVSKLRRTWFLV